MNAKEKVKLFKKIFEEAGIDKKVFEEIENKCIAMSHLGFSQSDIVRKLYDEVKRFVDNDSQKSEQDRFNLVNILEQYCIDLNEF